jgi:hypothetical protein
LKIVKEFISDDLFSKRNTLIQLLIKSSQYENQYFAYLLYDVLSNDTNGNVDTKEQTILFDSLPLLIKQYFRNAMKKTIQYTNELSNFDINKIPLEQQICLLLKEVYDFKVSEITEILQTTEAMVKYYLHTSRSKMVNIYEGRCALINKEGTCHQCSELNGIFNPKQDFEIEKNKIEFAKKANDPNREQLLDLRLQIMKEIDPFNSKNSPLQLHHIQHNRDIMENYSEKNVE